MSLNQKYTWNDFLKENPELKEKKVKRTSSEGKKAFEAAYKTKIKDFLKEKIVWIEKEAGRVQKKKDLLTGQIKETKRTDLKKVIQTKIGKSDKYLSRTAKMTEKTKQIQKSF